MLQLTESKMVFPHSLLLMRSEHKRFKVQGVRNGPGTISMSPTVRMVF